MNDERGRYAYSWPPVPLEEAPDWPAASWDDRFRERQMPEAATDVRADSRWPAMFPAPITLLTAGQGRDAIIERVVGASIVNRFPYVMAVSLCRADLSPRHYARRVACGVLEEHGTAVVQLLAPGRALDATLTAIRQHADAAAARRLPASGLSASAGQSVAAPVLADAYLAYEARLVRPRQDATGAVVFPRPWIDVGSHRVYFLEITAIQLDARVADGTDQIHWQALPDWQPRLDDRSPGPIGHTAPGGYRKTYTPHYAFPSDQTIAFDADEVVRGMAIKHLPAEPADQVEVDNDRARWPCFFPSSAGLITTWDGDDRPNLMPCGSTTVISRHPFTLAICVSYAAINTRYAPRATLDIIDRTQRFGCGVPFIDDVVVDAIRFTGNRSLAGHPDKAVESGLELINRETAPIVARLPIHFDCVVRASHRLGTHRLFIGEVERVAVRRDVTPANPVRWCPYASVLPRASSTEANETGASGSQVRWVPMVRRQAG